MANVTNRANAQYPAGPSTGAIIAAAVFWVVAIALVLATTVFDVPGWVWAVRIISVLVGVGIAIGLILREKYLRDHGLPLDSDKTAFDLWTIAHTMAGVVMGAWTVSAILVIIFTIAWEFFEKYVPGFGDGEIFSNRVVDVLVAWAGWIVLAAIISAGAQIPIPWGFP